MAGRDILTIISIVAENRKYEEMEEVLKKLKSYAVHSFNSIDHFLSNIEHISPSVVIIDSIRYNEQPIRNVKQFFREEFDIPVIYIPDGEEDPVLKLEDFRQPHEYILDYSSLREIELAVNLTIDKYFSEKIIKNGELQFKVLLENSSDLFTIVDKRGVIKYESPSVKRMLGYTPEELIGKEFFDLIHTADLERCKNAFYDNISRGKSSFLIRFRYSGRNNQHRIIDALFSNLLSVKGVESIIITGKDVTDKRTIEKKFLTNLKRYNALIENLPIGVYRSTPSGELLIANSFLIKMLGYSSFREMEKVDINSSYVQQSIREIFKEVIDRFGEAKGFEFEIRRKNGDIIFVRDSSRAIYDEKGNIAYYEGVLEDISDKKKYEREIILAKETAEKADTLKSYFMAHLSHEIRTPVNSILTFVSLLKEEFEPKLPAELHESFQIIENSADRLIRTIDLIMNLSSLQTGNFDAKYSWLDIENDILNEIINEYSGKAKRKEIKFSYINRAKNTKIYADKFSAYHMISNLIDNAIKYTPENGKISMFLTERGNDLRLEIIDTGIGISREYLPNLFTPFTQEEMGYTRKYEGNGLGLAISKKYAELNNAIIEAKSIKGQGSNFTITFKEAVKTVATGNF